MPIDLAPLASVSRLLFAVELVPIQGSRFQPTGFPNLGAASYQAGGKSCLLVESAQSMANRLEGTAWNSADNTPVAALTGISHVTVTRKGAFLTDSMLESHRINSPYLLEGKDRTFANQLKKELGGLEEGPINRALLAKVLMRYDVGSLIHGVFLAKKELAGGRLRVARAISAFIEASGVRVAASGGVKNDHVNPSGETKSGFGNVPFARDEYSAEAITCFANVDLSQLRGYGLGEGAIRLLILIALFKLRALWDGDLRLRTACDLVPKGDVAKIAATNVGFTLPSRKDIEADLRIAIAANADLMTAISVTFEDEIKKGKGKADDQDGEDAGED